MEHPIRFTLNHEPVELRTEPGRRLLGVLRHELGLTGTKYGCGEGQCGACTVLIDGEARRACMLAVSELTGRRVLTIEGLARGRELHPVQQAFIEEDAVQCGFCTPGMVLSCVALLKAHPDPDPPTVVRALDGNLCRCGEYRRILSAVRRAAARLRSATPSENDT
jgi:aerobic-type carbon monoxide dehydrogenase small subunit (CoxS/CutS family)